MATGLPTLLLCLACMFRPGLVGKGLLSGVTSPITELRCDRLSTGLVLALLSDAMGLPSGLTNGGRCPSRCRGLCMLGGLWLPLISATFSSKRIPRPFLLSTHLRMCFSRVLGTEKGILQNLQLYTSLPKRP